MKNNKKVKAWHVYVISPLILEAAMNTTSLNGASE